MKFSRFIVIPIIIATLAALLQVVDQLIAKTPFFSEWNGFAWISFQAWALYFLAGCTVKGGVRTLLSWIAGIIGSILIMKLGGSLSALGFWAVPLALLILVIPVICLERVPWFDFIPGLFVGAGAYFAMMGYIVTDGSFCKGAVVALTYCVIGLVFGYITVLLRSKYEACVAKKTA